MEGIAFYLLWKAEKRRNIQRRHVWVHDIIRKRRRLGEFHRLLQERRLDDGRFQRYFRLNVSRFDDLLDTDYRRSVSAAERLSICLR